jgi:hypothetical protein
MVAADGRRGVNSAAGPAFLAYPDDAAVVLLVVQLLFSGTQHKIFLFYR